MVKSNFKPIDFKPKGWLWYPENIRGIKSTAQRAAFMKMDLWVVYKKEESATEKKGELYKTLLDAQYIISQAWKLVREWENIGQFKKYTRALEERYDREQMSLKAALQRVEKAYNEIKKEGD